MCSIVSRFFFSSCRCSKPLPPVLEHGSPKHRSQTLDHLINGLLEYAVSEQGSKSIIKALKEGGKDVLNRIIKKMCEPAKGSVSFLNPVLDANLIKCSSRDDCRPCPFRNRQSTHRCRPPLRRQRPTSYVVRLHQGTYRHSQRMQNWFESYLAIVRVFYIKTR